MQLVLRILELIHKYKYRECPNISGKAKPFIHPKLHSYSLRYLVTEDNRQVLWDNLQLDNLLFAIYKVCPTVNTGMYKGIL